MSDSLVVAAVRRRLLDPARRVDYSRLAPSSLPAPATTEVLAATERALGFRLLPLHAALFSGVANGGFGPGDGLIGLDGENADGDGRWERPRSYATLWDWFRAAVYDMIAFE